MLVAIRPVGHSTYVNTDQENCCGCFNLLFAHIILKEVIQPQVPLRLPCYDFTPVAIQTLGASFPKVGPTTSGPNNSRGVTGGVYKARERIHPGVLIQDY